MDSNKVRQTFLDFFKSKGHHIVPSAPMVVKGDPTLMFNNSGMAPFKDIFLGNSPIKYPRIADTQKCLRVSGKHNDLEEVGVDTYHHTMFEMLGNWSFGDYFKKDAISWAWELLTEVYKIDKDRLYVTVFEGSKEEGLAFDQEAYDTWKQFVNADRILNGNKKDNFWEMGDMGPCGPCSEIHYDGRSDVERSKITGASLVNNDDPQVIEIWNNVFMEFERKADGSLIKLPKQHVDTGMGFERLVRVLQGKQSNYDSDVFTPLIHKIEELSGLRYKPEEEDKHKKQLLINIAMRVIADHIRTISFSIADGQLPGNTGAGYVIRRILRRAIRYGYQTLNLKEPFMYRIVPTLAHQMGTAFPELHSQKILIEKVIKEEEISFYKTLDVGLKRIDQVCIDTTAANKQVIDGKIVFELYDTFGFPVDLTSLIARGYNLSIDEKEFDHYLNEQKNRSRAATTIDTDDWMYVEENRGLTESQEKETEFIGYSDLECEAVIIRYRKVKAKNKEHYHLVLNKTPFYSESGGQVGDTGVLANVNESVFITDTKKENGVIIHYCDKLPIKLNATFNAKVNTEKRLYTSNNHSATHLLHAALRNVLGTHVEQKGSLVNDEHLRFDFSHFSKISDEEINQIEKMVNTKIRENITCKTELMPIEDAKKTGAMALFGEKYGDVVRVVTIDKNYSVELCGGTHVSATGQIGYFKLTSEGAVAAGIRRIEAITSIKAEEFFDNQTKLIEEIKVLLKNPRDISKGLTSLIEENNTLQKSLQSLYKEKAAGIKKDLIAKIEKKGDVNFITHFIQFDSGEEIKNLLFELRNEVPNLFCVLAAEVNGKPSISVIINDTLVKEKGFNAGNIVRDLAKEINGGGGGQPFYAQAGGSKPEGLKSALDKAANLI
ncbi:alanine--tRNA ligase [Aurantibacillus circumpalustris]|uniref:alanine--tRNA ligase n=1 Tax=Aurantibacillus circumpalustris TaxID=3036359 RepID=UPI00295B8B5D|nr:alanine--tRNA ligase [Aurantibacillus circumpalustris]